jgi:hypothetical protein
MGGDARDRGPVVPGTDLCLRRMPGGLEAGVSLGLVLIAEARRATAAAVRDALLREVTPI